MRERKVKGVWLASLLAVLAVVSVSVRAEAGEIRANVPFSFMVNGETLPPGTYTVTTVQGHVLFVRGFGSGAVVLTNGLASRDETQPKLVFHKYGERYILRQAWMGGVSGRELPQSRLERELKQTARNGAVEVEQVVVPAS